MSRHWLLGIIDKALFYISIMSLGAILYDIGFQKDAAGSYFVNSIYVLCLGLYLFGLVYKKRTVIQVIRGEKIRFSDALWFGMIAFLVFNRFMCFFNVACDSSTLTDFLTHFAAISIFVIELSRISRGLDANSMNPSLLFSITFVLLILFGALLLSLPNAVNPGKSISFVDAVFTSTSAVCVTGLAVQDTQHFFSTLGQSIILLLIQLGGLGVMTFTSFFGFFLTGGHSFKSQLMVKDMVNANQLGDVFRTLLKIILITFGIELMGAFWLYFSLDPASFPDFWFRVWMAIFHSISAFCNAGFSLISLGLYDPTLQFNYSFQLGVISLITLGGIGFPIVFNFYAYLKQVVKYHFLAKKSLDRTPPSVFLSLNTKIVVIVSSILIIVGTVTFWMFEMDNTLKPHTTLWGQFVTSLFGSVTPRTAGFNTIDYAQLTVPTLLITLFLMWVGASPASTGGGIKTTVLALGTLNIINIARGKERIEIFRREISESSIRKAFAIICLSLIVLGFSTFLLYTFEFKGDHLTSPNNSKDLMFIAFECFSAFGTVGLSMGLTPTLSDGSKWVLIGTMFIGRVGMLTLVIAILRQAVSARLRYPKEDIMT